MRKILAIVAGLFLGLIAFTGLVDVVTGSAVAVNLVLLVLFGVPAFFLLRYGFRSSPPAAAAASRPPSQVQKH